jgi:hypothetical protein
MRGLLMRCFLRSTLVRFTYIVYQTIGHVEPFFFGSILVHLRFTAHINIGRQVLPQVHSELTVRVLDDTVCYTITPGGKEDPLYVVVCGSRTGLGYNSRH